MFKKKSILCVLLAIIFTVATSCTNQSNQDNVVKTKKEWITEFSKDICKTCFPYQLGDEKDYYYIYELLIQEDGLVQGNAIIGDLKYNYVFKQIVISGDFYFYLFLHILLFQIFFYLLNLLLRFLLDHYFYNYPIYLILLLYLQEILLLW